MGLIFFGSWYWGVCFDLLTYLFALMRILMMLFLLVAAKLYIPKLNHQKEGIQEHFMVKFLADEKRVWFLSSGRDVLFEGKPNLLPFLFSLISLLYFIL